MTQGRDEPLSYEAPAPQVEPAPRPDAAVAPPAADAPAPAADAAAPAADATAAAVDAAASVAPGGPSADEPATPQFRVRDFSPEGRATGRRAAPPPLIEPGSAPLAPPSDLEYRTEVGPGAVNIPASALDSPIVIAPPTAPFAFISEHPVEAAADNAAVPEAGLPATPAAPDSLAAGPAGPAGPAGLAGPAGPAGLAGPVAPAAQAVDAPSTPAATPEHHTMSRRELRQKLAQESTASSPLTSHDPSLATGPQNPSLVTGSNPSLVTGPQNPSLATGPQNPSLVTGPQNPSLVTGPQNPSLVTGSQPPPPAASSMSAIFAPPPPTPDFESLSRSGQLAPPAAGERVSEAPVAAPSVSPSFAPDFSASFIEPEVEHTGGWVAPVGHWSRQADLDDETQPFENTVTREVGGGNVATTTSALVLPEMPRANPFPSALDVTGEILLTGSIELPRSLSSGAGDSRRIDTGDVDLMFDDKDREVSTTDSAPVSAIRAVSTHTSARGVISSANKPNGNRMLTVLFVTASVMAVGVVGLLIVSIVGRLF